MIKVRQFPGIASLVLVLLLAGCVQPAAQKPAPVSRLAQITGAGVIRVGVAVDLPPFTFFDRQGERRGFDVELVSEIAQRLGVQVAWVDLAYEPLRAAVRERKVDLGIGAIPYIGEWDRDVDFTQPYYDLGQPGPADPGLLYIILPQNEKALAQRLNEIIAQLEGEGFIQRLAQKHLAPQGNGP